MNSSVWGKGFTKDNIGEGFPLSSRLFLVLVPIMIALPLGVVIGRVSFLFAAGIVGALLMVLAIALRQDQLAAILVVAVRVYIDWYAGLDLATLLIVPTLLLVFFLARSARFPWSQPRVLWLWVIFLILALSPAMRGISFSDGIYYYSTVIFSALLMLWLGSIVARDLRGLFILLTFFGTLIAIHTIIEANTGIFLLKTTLQTGYASRVGTFTIGAGNSRAESFFLNPNSTGGFFSLMICISLGLVLASSSLLGKVCFFIETCILTLALLFTYSAGSWVATCAGLLVFFILVGRNSYRLLLSSIILVSGGLIIALLPDQLNLLLHHATSVNEIPSRIGAWQTGIEVIRTFPLTGVGLGRHVYVLRAEPYRAVTQLKPLDHPHNSILELAALGGIPLGIVFVALLVFTLWLAFRNWLHADVRSRILIGSGIAAAIALTCYSMTDAGWTLPPLLAIGWLILGAVSSPFLTKDLSRAMKQAEKSSSDQEKF